MTLLRKNKFSLLAFLIPVLGVTLGFALMRVRPFGTNSLLAMDLWGQYFPMLSSPGGTLWSWNGGLGFNALAQSAYYTNSPFNYIIYLLPQAARIDAVDWLVVLRAGLAGFTFSLWLRKRFGKDGLMLAVFASAYALCAYFIAFISQIMWLDAVWLLPLVILGLHRLIDGRSPLLYTLSLAATIFSNFYISWAVCLFCGLYFLARVLSDRPRSFFPLCARFALYSLCAGGLSAVTLLPVWKAIQLTAASEMDWGGKLKLYHSLSDIADNLVPFAKVSLEYGVPNLYCGLACLPLCLGFAFSRKIPLRRRIAFSALMIFLLLSFNLNLLDYVWHGFHYPNQLPGRQSFIFAFLALTLAFEGLLYIRTLTAGLASAGALAAAAISWGALRPYALALLLVILALLTALRLGKRAAYYLLAAVMTAECVSSAAYMMGNQVRRSDAVGYNRAAADIRQLVSGYSGDYRVEVTPHFTFGTPQLAGYRGITCYSSLMPYSSYSLFKTLGCSVYAKNVSTIYVPWPALNALFGVKYIFDRSKTGAAAPGLELTESRPQGDVYENVFALPLGFMAGAELSSLSPSGSPAEAQNAFFAAACGAEAIYSRVAPDLSRHENCSLYSWDGVNRFTRKDSSAPAVFEYTYTLPEDGEYMLYTAFGTGSLTLSADGAEAFAQGLYYPSVRTLGRLSAGTELTLRAEVGVDSSTCGAELFLFDGEALGAAAEELSEGGLRLSSMTSRSLEGRIDAGGGGLMFLSIPYDEGWTVRVDGERAEAFPVWGDLTGVELPAGEHEITLSYISPGFAAGAAISLASAALFVVLYIIFKKRER